MSNTNKTSRARAKPPSLLACISCRKSHLRCDGQKPQCGRCADRNANCIWQESRRGYRDYHKTPNPNERIHSLSPSATHSNIARPMSPDHPPGGDRFVLDPALSANQNFPDDSVFGPEYSDLLDLDFQISSSCQETNPSPPSNGSTTPAGREIAPIDQNTDNSSKNDASENLIDIFYKNFYPAHPFVVPRKRSLQKPSLLPDPLRAAMRFIGSHYAPAQANRNALQRAAATSVFSENLPDDGFKVQALLLYCMACFARSDQMSGAAALEKCVETALRIDMNRHTFATNYGRNDAVLQESWRRTWWSLFIVDGITTAITGAEHPFQLYSVFSDVPLPGSCAEYNACRISSLPRSLAEMGDRTFSEDTYQWSSFAYCVEAMQIMGSAFELGPDTFAVTDPQVEALDASISHFLLSLPPEKREVVEHDGTVDEVLLLAHLIIHWAAILVHRPRSSLTFIRNHYPTACTEAHPAAGLPALAYASHTSKTLAAANGIISLAALHRPLSRCTPCLMCGITTAATVHLPAYAVANRADQAAAIKERLQLGISALGAFAEIWPRAHIARSQVATFVREVLAKSTNAAVGPGFGAVVDDSGTAVESGIGMPQLLEFGIGTNYFDHPWMESIMQVDVELDDQVSHKVDITTSATATGTATGTATMDREQDTNF